MGRIPKITHHAVLKGIFDMYTIRTSAIRRELRPVGAVSRAVLPRFTTKTIRAADALLKRYPAVAFPPKGVVMERFRLRRPDGTALRLCVYHSETLGRDGTGEEYPGILWIHGGGYAFGVPEMDSRLIAGFVRRSGAVVVAPDYTRSLERPYPAALCDCLAALRWMWRNRPELHIDPWRISVGGESAGGGLAAAVCLYQRDRGEVPVALQMPLCPMMDARDTATSADSDAPVWNTDSNDLGWGLYLRDCRKVSRYASPAYETDLSDMPPMITTVGTIDPLLAETDAYAERLRASGVPVVLRHFEGCFHGFEDVAPHSRAARSAREFVIGCYDLAMRAIRDGRGSITVEDVLKVIGEDDPEAVETLSGVLSLVE